MIRPARSGRSVPLVAALSAAVVLTAAPAAFAKAPGDNGDVKVHRTTTAVSDERDDPMVCRFYLDAFQFDTIQQVSWSISQQPPTGRKKVLSGTLALANGTGHTVTLGLPNGHYDLTWRFAGEHGSAKHKVFMVSCPPPVSLPPGTTTTGGHVNHPGAPGGSSGTGGMTGVPVGAVGAGAGGASQGMPADRIAAVSVLLTAAAASGWTLLSRRRRTGGGITR